MCSPVAPDVFGEPEFVHDVLDDAGDLADVLPGVPLARIEIDQQVVRTLDVVDPAMPGVQVDTTEVGDPGEPGGVVDDGKVDPVPAGENDVNGLEPVGMGIRDALLVEEESVHAVGVAEHLHRPLANVRQHLLGHVEVVLDEVALREAGLREEHLVEVRESNLATADADHPGTRSPFVGTVLQRPPEAGFAL
jgi:hypothetical protein